MKKMQCSGNVEAKKLFLDVITALPPVNVDL
jgi:hypothetical protein